jgi:dolichol-phosphate mannosyltransferase
MKEDFRQFIKFLIVGGLGTIITIVLLYIFTEFVGIYYIISSIFAFIIAMTHNFILNKIWTFKEKISLEFWNKYLKFVLVSISAFAVNISFLYIFTELIGIYYLLSQVLAIGVAFIINFSGSKLWAFKK